MTDARPPLKVDLRQHSLRADLPDGDVKGRPAAVRLVWLLCNLLVMRNPLFLPYAPKRWLLRRFGARIGDGVVIKPGVNVKSPWYLEIGDHSWIGEAAWLDCTSPLRIGQHAVVSQGVYLCCGMHDWRDPGMGSVSTPITIEDGAWVAAFARVAGPVTIGQEAMVAMGAVVLNHCEPRGIYRGNPAARVAERRIRDYAGPPRGRPSPGASE